MDRCRPVLDVGGDLVEIHLLDTTGRRSGDPTSPANLRDEGGLTRLHESLVHRGSVLIREVVDRRGGRGGTPGCTISRVEELGYA
jgi:hypothetical protein